MPARYRDLQSLHVAALPEHVFAVVSALGGRRGWLAYNGLWQLRGWLDRLAGGPGMRGHPGDAGHSGHLYVGAVVDVWRVEVVEPPTRLRFVADMRVPGEAWLEFRAEPDGAGTRFIQEARFAPHGLFGHLYWYAMVPAHLVLFPAMAKAIARTAAARTAETV